MGAKEPAGPTQPSTPSKVAEKVYLHILVGQEKAEHVIEKPRITLGCQEQNDVVLTAEGISNFHAEMFRTDEGWQIKDLGSTNGTYVNGQRIAFKPLSNKDKIVIGKVLLRFCDQKPVPPRMAIYAGLAALLLALLAGSFIKDSFSGGNDATGDQPKTPQEQAKLYADIMEKGLQQFEEKDYEGAKKTFHAAKRRYESKSAPNNMLRLTEIFTENPTPATFPWEKVKGVLNDLNKECPETERYKQFVARELGLIDKDRACAEYIKAIFAPDATEEDKFRLLHEAGEEWPDSRIYQLFNAQLVPIGAQLVKKYAEQGDAQIDAAKQRLLEEKWQESGDAFTKALDHFKKAQTFDVNRINRELDEKIKKTGENVEAFQQFIDGVSKSGGGQTEEATKAFGLVRFGTEYYTYAQAQIQGLRLEGQVGGIIEKYLNGEISIALDRIRKLKTEGKDNKNLMRELTRLESKLSRIERAWLAMGQSFDAKDYRGGLEQAQLILELEREERSGNHYVNEANRIQAECRREIERIYGEVVGRLTDALKAERYSDVPALIDEAKKKQLEATSTDVDDRVKNYMKPLAKDLVGGLERMRYTGGDKTDPERYRNLKFGAQLIIEYLGNDAEMSDTVERAKKALR